MTTIAILRPKLSAIKETLSRLLFLGKRALVKTKPGKNSAKGNANTILTGDVGIILIINTKIIASKFISNKE